MTPKIAEATIGEQRTMRQRQIMDAAMTLALESGAPSVTVAAVAKRAGISRSLVYEYFSSSADLITDLVLEELEYYKNRLTIAVEGVEDEAAGRVLEILLRELPLKQAVQLAVEISGGARNTLYKRALELKKSAS